MMDAEKFTELASLYAVGALDEVELREFENYLHNASADERRELNELTDAAAMMPLALPATLVPASVKARLFQRVEAENKITPIPVRVAPEPKKSSWFDIFNWQPATGLFAAASLLLALTTGFLFWKNNQVSHQRDVLAQQVDELSKLNIATSQQLNELVTQTTKLISMKGQATPNAQAKVFWDTKQNQWVVYVLDLPATPVDKVYQLWYITNDAQKLSAATFRTDANGRGQIRVSVPSSTVPKLTATAVTMEPQGGSAQPTGQIQLVGATGA